MGIGEGSARVGVGVVELGRNERKGGGRKAVDASDQERKRAREVEGEGGKGGAPVEEEGESCSR